MPGAVAMTACMAQKYGYFESVETRLVAAVPAEVAFIATQ